jgi:poly(3-hydroxybutyrate) depolymerase
MYAIGTSNGAGMVNKLALETNHFKAIAPVVSQLIESLQFNETTQPISVFQINGAADTTVPIEGGLRMGHNFLDAYESASLWASEFNCANSPVIIHLGDDTLYIFESCDNDKEIQYLRIENGEHNLHWGPGSQQLFHLIWSFLQRF